MYRRTSHTREKKKKYLYEDFAMTWLGAPDPEPWHLRRAKLGDRKRHLKG